MSLKSYRKQASTPRVSEVEVMTLVKEKRIGSKDLKELKSLSTQNDALIASWMNINVKTYRSYRDSGKSLPEDISEHIILLLSLFKQGKKIFNDSLAFDVWLTNPNFFFDDASPIDFLRTISGIRFISSRLTALEFGDNI